MLISLPRFALSLPSVSGMDKLIHDQGRVTISNDGATIIKLLDIVHPAAKTLCDIAKSQDDEVNHTAQHARHGGMIHNQFLST